MTQPVEASRAHDTSFAGYHQFTNDEGHKYGSFEVFHYLEIVGGGTNGLASTGWYWQACFPGCLPDAEANGPFPTAEGAYLDAIGD
jgi:hypothetical protein